MKKLLTLLLLTCLLLSGCGSKLIEGSEQAHYGTVTDSAMSVVHEGDRQGRAYLIIETAAGEELCFWLARGCQSRAQIGDKVTVESAVEARTNLLVATAITLE